MGSQALERKPRRDDFSTKALQLEIKQQAETEETQPCRTSVLERAKGVLRSLPSSKVFAIRDRVEPSDALIDASVGLYESNRLRFIEWTS